MTLTFRNVHVTYPGSDRLALRGVSAEIAAGQRVALVGRNGSGKSTLMLVANGILRPQQGELLLDGRSVRYDRRSLAELRRQVGVVFQNPDDQLFSASVYQDISLGPLNLGLSQAEARARVLQAAELCGLGELLERPTHALSGGEKVRVALAGVLAMSPRFLFADELINGLDPWMRRQVLHILERLSASGCAVILATHDWGLAREWADYAIWMDAGRVFRQGKPQTVLSGPECPD
ncbi:MAG: energy-coupling factor ABC transporter ATP-binding protein [Thermoflexales bacterium]|nr:energy-coupling factor ABC transporter ATP-binding protein [Thermoflexales bacterium]MDW8352366.1 ABC transporter ATP-binding protein [Anaerolineae bacterium]